MIANAHKSELRHLSMANTGLGPGGGACAGRILRHRWTNLAHLSLSFNRLGPDGARDLAAALQVDPSFDVPIRLAHPSVSPHYSL